LNGLFFTAGTGRLMRIAHHWRRNQHLVCTAKSWTVDKTVVGQFTLEYL